MGQPNVVIGNKTTSHFRVNKTNNWTQSFCKHHRQYKVKKMSKLDDLLGKKKEIVPVLDLSKTIVHSKEEYKRLLEKVPDYKMRPIKVNISWAISIDAI